MKSSPSHSGLVFASACLSMLIFGMGLITLGSVSIGLQEKFQLDKIAAGSLFSILPFGIVTGSLLFGPACDRYGYKLFLIISCILMFIGFQGIAFAPSLFLLKCCVFLFGMGGGALNGASNALVADISTKNKAANLSLLGVFFALGALGMPFILGSLHSKFDFQSILAVISFIPATAIFLFLITRFPDAKHGHGFPIGQGIKLLKDPFLLTIAFFLFCQSSFEGIINNWTTMYLSQKINASEQNALFGLSLFVTGMAVVRLLIGSVFRDLSQKSILAFSFLLMFMGAFVLWSASAYSFAVLGLIALGAGLAAGFPIMLGFIGHAYASISATAFGVVLTIALIGNMLINYLMGILAEYYGIQYMTTLLLILTAIMAVLAFRILNTTKN
ncbi:MAG: MFS transporter [Saprospiraceae bacterium]|nr:MFS transporter [Saprospiraceae bacterium]